MRHTIIALSLAALFGCGGGGGESSSLNTSQQSAPEASGSSGAGSSATPGTSSQGTQSETQQPGNGGTTAPTAGTSSGNGSPNNSGTQPVTAPTTSQPPASAPVMTDQCDMRCHLDYFRTLNRSMPMRIKTRASAAPTSSMTAALLTAGRSDVFDISVMVDPDPSLGPGYASVGQRGVIGYRDGKVWIVNGWEADVTIPTGIVEGSFDISGQSGETDGIRVRLTIEGATFCLLWWNGPGDQHAGICRNRSSNLWTAIWTERIWGAEGETL